MNEENSDLVSIIMPAYNASKFIESVIDSILSQTFLNWELLITDDCSLDNTFDILSEYSSKDERIKIFRLKNNSGAAVARNNSLYNAKGRFIAFCDCDDVWISEKLTKQVDFMKKNNFPISFTAYGVYSEDLLKENYDIRTPVSIDYYGYLKNTIIGMSTSMIDRNIVKSFKFYNIRTRQDTYLWISLLKRGYIAYGLNEKLVKYRVRNNSISANKFKAAKRVWFLYYELEKLGFLKSLYYFCCYAKNALKKRL